MTIDNKLNFKQQVAQATINANKIVGLIRGSINYLTEKMFVTMYKSLVRPLLEYGSLWTNSFAKKLRTHNAEQPRC